MTKMTVLTDAVISNAKRFAETHLTDELLILRVSNEVARMRAHEFCILFQEREGVSFADFLATVRIEKAKTLLLNPVYTEGEIAAEVGFGNVTTFRRTFVRIVGETPTKYRKRIPSDLQGTD